MSEESKDWRAGEAAESWPDQARRFGLTQEQTHVVPAVWRRRKARQRLHKARGAHGERESR